MDSVNCCVRTCSYENSKQLPLYPPPPPSFEEWHVQWLTAVGQIKTTHFSNGTAELESSMIQSLGVMQQLVCARHFEADCFDKETHLKVNALPTKFMPSYDKGHKLQQECLSMQDPVPVDLDKTTLKQIEEGDVHFVIVGTSSPFSYTDGPTDSRHEINLPCESPTWQSTDFFPSGELEHSSESPGSSASNLLHSGGEDDWSLTFSPTEEIQQSDVDLRVRETDLSTPIASPMSVEIEIPSYIIVEETESQDGEPSAPTRSRKPKKKKSIKKRKPDVRQKKGSAAQEAEMDSALPDEDVFVSTPQPTAFKKKRKLESSSEASRSLRLNLRKSFKLPKGVDGISPQFPLDNLRIKLTDILKQNNIQYKNISEYSRFRVDQTGNIQPIELTTADPIMQSNNTILSAPSTSTAPEQNVLQDTPSGSHALKTRQRKSKKPPPVLLRGESLITEDELDQLAANTNPAIFIRKVMRKVFSPVYFSTLTFEKMDENHQMVIIEATLKRYRFFLRANGDRQKISANYIKHVMETEFNIHHLT